MCARTPSMQHHRAGRYSSRLRGCCLRVSAQVCNALIEISSAAIGLPS